MTAAPAAPPPDPAQAAALADAARRAGGAAFRAGALKEAAAHFGNAVAWAPHNPTHHANAAAAALALGDARAALAAARSAARLGPGEPKAHARLGEAAAACGQCDVAAAAWKAAAQLRPGCAATARKAAASRAAAADAAHLRADAATLDAAPIIEAHLKVGGGEGKKRPSVFLGARAATTSTLLPRPRAPPRAPACGSSTSTRWQRPSGSWRSTIGTRGGGGGGGRRARQRGPTSRPLPYRRPTHLPSDRLTPTHNPHPASRALASLAAAATDAGAPRAAATAAADPARAAAWRAGLAAAIAASSPAAAHVRAAGCAGGLWGLVAAAVGAGAVTIAERHPLATAFARAGLAANASAPWAWGVRVVQEEGEGRGGSGDTAPPFPPPATTTILAVDAVDHTVLGAGLLPAVDAAAAAGRAAAEDKGARAPCLAVLPARVVVWAQLVDATPPPAAGVDVSCLVGLRWGLQPEAVDAAGCGFLLLKGGKKTTHTGPLFLSLLPPPRCPPPPPSASTRSPRGRPRLWRPTWTWPRARRQGRPPRPSGLLLRVRACSRATPSSPSPSPPLDASRASSPGSTSTWAAAAGSQRGGGGVAGGGAAVPRSRTQPRTAPPCTRWTACGGTR